MHPLLTKLEAALRDTSDVYVAADVTPEKYFQALEADLRSRLCTPFMVTAEVMPPGFPDHHLGERLSGYCVAHTNGHWLVYAPDEDRFYCFWGADQHRLGAHGVFGSPLYCWSA